METHILSIGIEEFNYPKTTNEFYSRLQHEHNARIGKGDIISGGISRHKKEMIGICVYKGRSVIMVFIDIVQDELFITLNCHKGSEQGEFFQLIIDARTKKVMKKPKEPDIDASIAYSHIYTMMKNGKPLPAHTVAS